MDLSHVEDEREAEIYVAVQRQELRRCYTCGSTKHLRLTCLLRKQQLNPVGRNPIPNLKSGMAHGNVDTQ